MLNDQVIDVVKAAENQLHRTNRRLMVAARTASSLATFENVSSLRRIVRTFAKRWDRIVQLAATKGEKLPYAGRLQGPLMISCCGVRQPILDHFRPDLSPRSDQTHRSRRICFGGVPEILPLDTSASRFRTTLTPTAPIAAFVDVVTQRLIKAMLAGQKNPLLRCRTTAIGG